MSPKKILVVLLVYSAALRGLVTYLDVEGIAEPQWITVSSSILFSLLIFWWYWLDSEERSYRRTPLLNVSVVALSFLAIPYYLIRSRAKGDRLRAIGKSVGFFVLMMAALLFGGLPYALLRSA